MSFLVVAAGPVLAHSRASASVKNSLRLPRGAADDHLGAAVVLVDFGAGWISGASMRQAFTP